MSGLNLLELGACGTATFSGPTVGSRPACILVRDPEVLDLFVKADKIRNRVYGRTEKETKSKWQGGLKEALVAVRDELLRHPSLGEKSKKLVENHLYDPPPTKLRVLVVPPNTKCGH